MAAKGYQHELYLQELAKRQKQLEDRNMDRVYAQLEMAQKEKEANSREIFFNHLKQFQDKNDLKAAALMNFMQGRDLATLSK